jgi:hypothetical protein
MFSSTYHQALSGASTGAFQKLRRLQPGRSNKAKADRRPNNVRAPMHRRLKREKKVQKSLKSPKLPTFSKTEVVLKSLKSLK